MMREKESNQKVEEKTVQNEKATIVSVKNLDNQNSELVKEFDGTKESIQEMLNFIGEFVDDQGLPPEFKNKLLIVGDELLSNVVKHGYEEKGGPVTIELTFDANAHVFCFTIIDQAKEFNQLDVNIIKDVNALTIGGYGISIVKKIMDEYTYRYLDGKNILVLKKKV